MKPLNNIEITPEEESALLAGQGVAASIWARWREANGGRSGEELDLKMVIAPCASGTPRAWWEVHPRYDHMRSGHRMSLKASLAEMHAHGTADLKKRQAEQYRLAAERLEREAKEE